jgi:hypothetical protein
MQIAKCTCLIFLFEFPPINPSAIGRLVVSYYYPEKHSDTNFLFLELSRSTLRHIEMLEINSGSHLGNNGESQNSFTFHLAFATWDRRVDKAIICS